MKDAHNLTAAQLSPEDAMYGHGFYPKKIWCDSLRFVFPTVGSIFVKTPRKKVDLVYHRANILDPDFKYVSVGFIFDPNSNYKTYWSQFFSTY